MEQLTSQSHVLPALPSRYRPTAFGSENEGIPKSVGLVKSTEDGSVEEVEQSLSSLRPRP